MAWNAREKFVYEVEPLAESIARRAPQRKPTGSGPVVLLDHYDNCASGGTMDTMAVLGGILDAGLEDVAAFAIYDPAGGGADERAPASARESRCRSAASSTCRRSGCKGKPRTVTGNVRRIVDGIYRNEGPMARGELADMGPTAVLDTGKVRDRRDLAPRRAARHRCVPRARHRSGGEALPDAQEPRALARRASGRSRKAVVECAGEGVCTSDYSQLKFRHVRRPIYPLDLINE